jgi:hypothetical protein
MELLMRRWRERIRPLVLWPAAAAAWVAAGWAAAAEPLELAVKAAYLAKFPNYVEWPATSLGSPGRPFVLCVVGEDPFGPLLDEAAAGQQVQGRPLAVRRLQSVGRESGCHVAYVGANRAESLRGSPVLVVSELPGAGIIDFVLRDNRVRFTVDDEAAAHAGLAISSRLLSVALAVKQRKARCDEGPNPDVGCRGRG